MSRYYAHNPMYHRYAVVALYIDRQPDDGAPDWHVDTQYGQITPHRADAPAHGADDHTILAEARALAMALKKVRDEAPLYSAGAASPRSSMPNSPRETS